MIYVIFFKTVNSFWREGTHQDFLTNYVHRRSQMWFSQLIISMESTCHSVRFIHAKFINHSFLDENCTDQRMIKLNDSLNFKALDISPSYQAWATFKL